MPPKVLNQQSESGTRPSRPGSFDRNIAPNLEPLDEALAKMTISQLQRLKAQRKRFRRIVQLGKVFRQSGKLIRPGLAKKHKLRAKMVLSTRRLNQGCKKLLERFVAEEKILTQDDEARVDSIRKALSEVFPALKGDLLSYQVRQTETVTNLSNENSRLVTENESLRKIMESSVGAAEMSRQVQDFLTGRLQKQPDRSAELLEKSQELEKLHQELVKSQSEAEQGAQAWKKQKKELERSKTAAEENAHRLQGLNKALDRKVSEMEQTVSEAKKKVEKAMASEERSLISVQALNGHLKSQFKIAKNQEGLAKALASELQRTKSDLRMKETLIDSLKAQLRQALSAQTVGPVNQADA